MASLLPKTAPHVLPFPITVANPSSPLLLPFRFHSPPLSALKASSSDADSLRGKPLLSHHAFDDDDDDDDDKWVDWEDQILDDTVPLVGFVRMILHSGQYENGDRLSPEHEKAILEKLLPFHPEFEKKIGCGVDYITVSLSLSPSPSHSDTLYIGYHPDFERSRCMFIVRQDGELVDFSYWKCIKGLIRKNYPLYADSFILRHFRKKSRNL
ncbi:Protein DCL, chloroplastic, partial [Mucuna pruriens]